MLEMDERDPAGTERGALPAAIEHGEPEYVAVIVGEPVEVAHLEADGADMERGAAREGRGGGGIGGVHAPYIGVSAGRCNRGAARVLTVAAVMQAAPAHPTSTSVRAVPGSGDHPCTRIRSSIGSIAMSISARNTAVTSGGPGSSSP